MEMLAKLDEAIPNEMRDLEIKLKEIMDIEQADELQIVNLLFNNNL